jgi:hypothetical protein
MPLPVTLQTRFGTIVPICEPAHRSGDLSHVFHPHFPSDVSRTSNLSLSAYLRTAQCMPGQDNMGNDLLMGRLDLIPVLDAHVRPFFLLYPRELPNGHTIARVRSVVHCDIRFWIIPSYNRV